MAGEVKAGRAYVEVMLKDRIAGGLRRTAARLRGFSRSVGAIGGGLLAGAGALAAPIIPAIQKASDFQEIMSKFNTVFGDQAGTVKTWGDEFANQVGRSDKQIADFMSDSQDLFVPLGFDAGSATELSKTITGLSIDLASFKNMQDADTLRDLHAALTGSGEVMKKYGVIVDEAAVKQNLLNQGIDPKKATNQQKVQARLNLILAGTTAAQGDAIRTSGSYANQMKRLKGAIENAQVALGSALLPTLTNFVAKASSAVAWVGEWIGRNPRIVQAVAALAAGLAVAGGLLVTAAGVAIALNAALGVLAATAAVVGATFAFILSPIGLVIAGIVGLIAAGIAWTGAWGSIVEFFNSTLGAMGNALANGDLALAGEILWTSLKVAFTQGTIGIRKAWIETMAGLAQIMDSVVSALRQTWISFTTGLAEMLLRVWENVQGLVGALAKVEERLGLDGPLTKLKDALTIDVDATVAALREDGSRKSNAAEQARRQREDARGERLASDLAATESRLTELQAARDARIAGAGGDTFTGRGSLLDRLTGFLGQAAGADPTLQELFPSRTDAPTPDASGGVAAASKIAGAFSSSGAAALARGGSGAAADRTAKATEQTAKEVAEMRKDIKSGALVYVGD